MHSIFWFPLIFGACLFVVPEYHATIIFSEVALFQEC
jgi:hypothetical protein